MFTLKQNKPLIVMIKCLILVIGLIHVSYLVSGIFLGHLGANPVEAITHETGNWALYFLLLTLAITPLRKLLQWKAVAGLRRYLGLWSFFYLMLHFSTYLVFDHFFSLASILDDIIKRPYITVGFAAFILMVPLALTSFYFAIKKLGKYWISLHKAIYLVSVLAIIHYLWLVKVDIVLPVIYGVMVFFLLSLRVYWWLKRKRHCAIKTGSVNA